VENAAGRGEGTVHWHMSAQPSSHAKVCVHVSPIDPPIPSRASPHAFRTPHTQAKNYLNDVDDVLDILRGLTKLTIKANRNLSMNDLVRAACVRACGCG
jgi:hypothetical protein